MDRNSFHNSAAVRGFVEWAGTYRVLAEGAVGDSALTPGRPGVAGLTGLWVALDIPRHPQYVPVGIHKRVPFTALPMEYSWRARGMASGNINEAAQLLKGFSQHLRAAVAAQDWKGTQQTCERILDWGGQRSRSTLEQVRRLGPKLPKYLQDCNEVLMQRNGHQLTSDGSLPGVPHMGSMWAKIYACLTGTPIYDSRAAGAIATLIETWRIATRNDKAPLPPELTFWAVEGQDRRTVRWRYPSAQDPGTLRYAARGTTPARWAGATVRLGWLLQELQGGQGTWAATHAIECALFMAGYDCSQINRPPPAIATLHRPSGLHLHP